MIAVEEEVLDAVHGDDQPRHDRAATLQVPDEALLRDPGQGAAQEEVVEPAEIENVQGSAREWSLGCVIPTSWPQLAAEARFTQPRDHSLAIGICVVHPS